MSKKWKKPGSGDKSPNGNPKPTADCRYDPIAIRSVRVQETTSDKEWKAVQKAVWRKQLRKAACLNLITAIAAGFAALYAGIAACQWYQARTIFRQQQSPEISMELSPQGFGTPNASVIVGLKNSGHSAARDISIRWLISSLTNNNIKHSVILSNGIHVPTLRFPVHLEFEKMLKPCSPGDKLCRYWNELAEQSDEERSLVLNFDNMADPTIPINEQFPILPSEDVYDRLRDLGRREADTEKQFYGFFPNLRPKQPETNWAVLLGTKYVAVGETGPSQSVMFTAQGEYPTNPSFSAVNAPTTPDDLNSVNNGSRVVYFSARFTYRDRFHSGIRKSVDFCFRYAPISQKFEMCLRPDR